MRGLVFLFDFVAPLGGNGRMMVLVGTTARSKWRRVDKLVRGAGLHMMLQTYAP